MNALKALVILLLFTAALAAPTPADVDAALRSGRPDVALELVEQARSEHLVSAKLDYLGAVARFRTGDLDGAAQSLSRARNIDPALAFANPNDVQAIDSAVNRRTGQGILLGLGLVLLAVAATFALRARDRRRKQVAEWQRALPAMRSRLRQREAQLDLELMEAEICRDQPEIQRLRDEQSRLWADASEAERGRLDPDEVAAGVTSLVLKRPVPRRATASRPERPTAPAPVQPAGASPPDDGLLTGVLLGQALSSASEAPLGSEPPPNPEPPRAESSDWNASSLSSSDSGSSSSDSSFSSSSSSDSW